MIMLITILGTTFTELTSRQSYVRVHLLHMMNVCLGQMLPTLGPSQPTRGCESAGRLISPTSTVIISSLVLPRPKADFHLNIQGI